MPISVSNELPHVNFPIGKELSDGRLNCLFDTGAAMCTGALLYHVEHIINVVPNFVKRYEKFDDVNNPFDPVKLCGAILDTSDYVEAEHGILSAVVEYYTPFTSIDGTPITVTIALGNDMSVDTILGIPFLDEIKLELRYSPSRHFFSSMINQSFTANYQETRLSRARPQSISGHNLTLTNDPIMSSKIIAPPPKSVNTNIPPTQFNPFFQVPVNYHIPEEDNIDNGAKLQLYSKQSKSE